MEHSLFVYVTGAGVSRTVAPLLDGLVAQGWRVYTVGTPNLEMVVPVAELLDRPGCQWIRGYKLHPLDIFPFGSMLVAPCTFNTFNKLGNGIADTLVTAMVAVVTAMVTAASTLSLRLKERLVGAPSHASPPSMQTARMHPTAGLRARTQTVASRTAMAARWTATAAVTTVTTAKTPAKGARRAATPIPRLSRATAARRTAQRSVLHSD